MRAFQLKQEGYMNKQCSVAIVVLLLVIVGGAYKFLIQGSVSQSTDDRIAVHLNASERDSVLEEMRAFLESVQKITQGISENDMKLVEKYAKKVGRAAQEEVPETLVAKIPMGFRKIGLDTHSKFDLLALDAESLGDSDHALKQLSTLMENCVACHTAYRFQVEE